MKITIQFQYMPIGATRPTDAIDHYDVFEVENGLYLPIPNVGDTVSYVGGDRTGTVVERKVKTRHFHYDGDRIWVSIGVADVSKEEMSTRLKA